MTEAQRIAGMGMDRARELLRPGVTAHEVATEATVRDDAGRRRGHEHADLRQLRRRDVHAPRPRSARRRWSAAELALIDLTPQVEGYCANLARTFVLGEPDARQRELLATYREIVARGPRRACGPGATVGAARRAGGRRLRAPTGSANYQVYGIGHGIGLRFEEPPGLDDHPAAPEPAARRRA